MKKEDDYAEEMDFNLGSKYSEEMSVLYEYFKNHTIIELNNVVKKDDEEER